jgi:CTP synthase
VEIEWIDSNSFEKGKVDLKDCSGLIIPGGFGGSGVEGKINAIKYARENKIPFLGLCYGLQLAVVEFARNVCKLDANTTEVNPNVKDPVIDILPEQKAIKDKGATMRLGSYPAILKEGTQVRKIYGKEKVEERHRHRYEVNPDYHKILQDKGLIFSGMSPDRRLVEFIELPNQFFIGTQAHPEFKSSFLHPAPLFDAFVKACLEKTD